MTALGGARNSAQGYFRASRSPRYSFLFAFPLLLAYEGLALYLPRSETHGYRVGAEVIMRSVFDVVGGGWGAAAFGAVMIGWAGFLVVRDMRANGKPDRASMYVRMILESVVLAFALGMSAGLLTNRVVNALQLLRATGTRSTAVDVPTQLMLSLGAGVFEELLFRVVLVSVLIALSYIILGTGPKMSAAIAVILSALIFSGYHYIGSGGDHFAWASFIDRAIGGLLLNLVYVLRGFGIAAWSHSLYDVGVLLLLGK